jgi:hypothetical protein
MAAGLADAAECRDWLACVRRVAIVTVVAADGWDQSAENAKAETKNLTQSTGGFAQAQGSKDARIFNTKTQRHNDTEIYFQPEPARLD